MMPEKTWAGLNTQPSLLSNRGLLKIRTVQSSQNVGPAAMFRFRSPSNRWLTTRRVVGTLNGGLPTPPPTPSRPNRWLASIFPIRSIQKRGLMTTQRTRITNRWPPTMFPIHAAPNRWLATMLHVRTRKR